MTLPAHGRIQDSTEHHIGQACVFDLVTDFQFPTLFHVTARYISFIAKELPLNIRGIIEIIVSLVIATYFV
jgi:hypothetical protein